ncbi:MAG: GNAT family N-acetyltransferase [Anaerolineales bacterium]|nr:GNAT family N-acetyltransferase [Anaerolineales bacterium]
MAEEFVIKILSASDLPLLMNVTEDIFDNPIDEKSAHEFLADPRHHIVVALSDNVIIGFASAVHYVHPDKPAELWINEVGVAQVYQNKGVGKAIMKKLLQLGQSLRCANAWVLTDRSNIPANRLYKSAGGEAASDDTVMYEFDLTGE